MIVRMGTRLQSDMMTMAFPYRRETLPCWYARTIVPSRNTFREEESFDRGMMPVQVFASLRTMELQEEAAGKGNTSCGW